jgi:hypothetical protein
MDAQPTTYPLYTKFLLPAFLVLSPVSLQELPQPAAEAQQPPPRRPQVKPQAHHSQVKASSSTPVQQA